jgi:hypothetical protein
MIKTVPTVFVENIVTTKKLKKLSIRDRFLILMGCDISFMVVTRCQHKPGKTEGSFNFILGRPVSETDVLNAVNSNQHPAGSEIVEQKKVKPA